MLTAKERIWLKNRERRLKVEHRYYSCKYCGWFNKRRHECEVMDDWYDQFCHIVHESFNDEYIYDLGPVYQDAAKFYELVAKKLACYEYKTPPGMTPVEAAVWERQKDGTLLMNAKASRLKCARINAEMEMDEWN